MFLNKETFIFEKKWIDLVFEDRNQEYGAYKLRQENPKTAFLADIHGNLQALESVFKDLDAKEVQYFCSKKKV